MWFLVGFFQKAVWGSKGAALWSRCRRSGKWGLGGVTPNLVAVGAEMEAFGRKGAQDDDIEVAKVYEKAGVNSRSALASLFLEDLLTEPVIAPPSL